MLLVTVGLASHLGWMTLQLNSFVFCELPSPAFRYRLVTVPDVIHSSCVSTCTSWGCTKCAAECFQVLSVCEFWTGGARPWLPSGRCSHSDAKTWWRHEAPWLQSHGSTASKIPWNCKGMLSIQTSFVFRSRVVQCLSFEQAHESASTATST